MADTKRNIKEVSAEELKTFLESKGEKSFRVKQINEWVWQKSITEFAQMRNLPKSTIELLDEHFYLYPWTIHTKQEATDGTVKVVFMLEDGKQIESVLIPSKDRLTACISSMAGCPLDCGFCATGLNGFTRNLKAHEIIDQVMYMQQLAQEKSGKGLSNIVYMGMGEPLLNYKNVVASINHITSDQSYAMSPSRITVSTSGISYGIKQLADDGVKFNLAISLHSAVPNTRSNIMPINNKHDLTELREAIRYFHEKTGTRITYEYSLFEGINDSIEDAKAFAEFCKVSPCKINLIPFNPVKESRFKPSSKETIRAFADFMETKNLIVNVRVSKGVSIDAACGQLANKNKPNNE